MTQFEQLDEARKLLGLGESATLAEIKSAYRKLAHRHHPDKNALDESATTAMQALNNAYQVIMEYCQNYRFNFQSDTVHRMPSSEIDQESWREKWTF